MKALFIVAILGLTFSFSCFASEDRFVESCAAKVESTDRESGKTQSFTKDETEVKTKSASKA